MSRRNDYVTQDMQNFNELKKIELITTVTGGSILGGVLGGVFSAINERRNKCNEKNPGTIIENIVLNGGLGAGLGALLGYVYAKQLQKGQDIGQGFEKIINQVSAWFKTL